MTTLLLAPPSGAASLSGLRAEAAAISARIQGLGQQVEALAERYDGAQLQLSQTEARVAGARRAVAAALADAAKARSVLETEAVNAYVSGGDEVPALSSLPSADGSMLETEYEQTVAGDQTAAESNFQAASLEDATAEAALRRQERAVEATLASIRSDRATVEAAQARLEEAYSADKGRIATLIAQQQAATRAAEQRQAIARLDAARAAAAAQAAPSTPSASPSTVQPAAGSSSFTPPPESSAAAIAVAAAESRLGDPYVWGGAGPTDFDCSGLVMWAYEQAGIYLPHFSGAQYADTVHIPMSELQPGDLVFFSNPDIHVAMYVGNGDVIQAPYPGAYVQIVPLYPELTLASRVA